MRHAGEIDIKPPVVDLGYSALPRQVCTERVWRLTLCGRVQQQVGGAGIGFGNSQDKDDTMQTLYGDRSEFTKGADLGGKDLLN